MALRVARVSVFAGTVSVAHLRLWLWRAGAVKVGRIAEQQSPCAKVCHLAFVHMSKD